MTPGRRLGKLPLERTLDDPLFDECRCSPTRSPGTTRQPRSSRAVSGGLASLVATRFVSVVTRDGEVDVCRAVPRPSHLRGQRYPDIVGDLDAEALVSLVRDFGREDRADASASDAPSWEDYDERMGYIVCRFRSYLREMRCYDEPFA